MNARDSKIPYPWLVFNEKIKVNSVFLRDSTAVSDSVLLLFGGSISRGDTVSFFFHYNSPLSHVLSRVDIRTNVKKKKMLTLFIDSVKSLN